VLDTPARPATLLAFLSPILARILFHISPDPLEILVSPERRLEFTLARELCASNFLVTHPPVDRIAGDAEFLCCLDRRVQLHTNSIRHCVLFRKVNVVAGCRIRQRGDGSPAKAV